MLALSLLRANFSSKNNEGFQQLALSESNLKQSFIDNLIVTMGLK
jgi:hypothetical protein